MSKVNKFKKPPRPTWYFITISECPVCGKSDTERDARFTKRPAQSNRRRKYTMGYCGCMNGALY